MPANKNHHFVPQFYLRNFGGGASVGLYDLERRVHLATASIRGQCQRPYLYGRNPVAEKALADLEGVAAQVVSDIIATSVPPPPGSKEYFNLITFVMFQWARTPAAGKVMDTFATKMARSMLKVPGVVPDRQREDIDSFAVHFRSPITNSMKLAATMLHLLPDLAMKIVVNRTSVQFLTSDAPVVFFNQWCQGTSGRGSTGLASAGLQVFLPLSPQHLLLLYDGDVYVAGKRDSASVEITAIHDAIGLNGLQLLTAERNLYHSAAGSMKEAINRLPFRWRTTRADAVALERALDETGREQRTHIYQAPAAAKVDLSFMRVTRRAKQVPLSARPSSYREAARRADEMVQGPRERKRNTPSTANRWHIIDD
jgi:hypothetical protein